MAKKKDHREDKSDQPSDIRLDDQNARDKARPKQVPAIDRVQQCRRSVTAMAQRARNQGEKIDSAIIDPILTALAEIERKLESVDVPAIDDLLEDAENQEYMRAYLCPRAEIALEAQAAVNELEEWGVPSPYVERLKEAANSIRMGKKHISRARATLRMIYQEVNEWNYYTDSYESDMRKSVIWLAIAAVLSITSALIIVTSPLPGMDTIIPAIRALGTIFFSGLAGSIASVLIRMPALDVQIAKERGTYLRRIIARLATGIFGSIIGCAALAWGILPVAVNGTSFRGALENCTTAANPCAADKVLIFLMVAGLFGFSERIIFEIEGRLVQEKPVAK